MEEWKNGIEKEKEDKLSERVKIQKDRDKEYEEWKKERVKEKGKELRKKMKIHRELK